MNNYTAPPQNTTPATACYGKQNPVRSSREFMKRSGLKNTALGVILLLAATMAVAVDKDDGEKMLSGMSIIGNSEAPKSLIIVPWKNSEIGDNKTQFATGHLIEGFSPVDKAVFMRELEFYKLSNPNQQ